MPATVHLVVRVRVVCVAANAVGRLPPLSNPMTTAATRHEQSNVSELKTLTAARTKAVDVGEEEEDEQRETDYYFKGQYLVSLVALLARRLATGHPSIVQLPFVGGV